MSHEQHPKGMKAQLVFDLLVLAGLYLACHLIVKYLL